MISMPWIVCINLDGVTSFETQDVHLDVKKFLLCSDILEYCKINILAFSRFNSQFFIAQVHVFAIAVFKSVVHNKSIDHWIVRLTRVNECKALRNIGEIIRMKQ